MRTIAIAALALFISATASTALAQRSEQSPPFADGARVGGGLVTGFAGNLELDVEGSAIFDVDDDLLASIGFDVFVEYAFMKYIALGARSSLVWWNADSFQDADISRSFLWTIDAMAKAKYPFAIENLGAEVFLAVPLGLTVSVPSGEINGNPNVAPGFNIAIMGGFALWFTEQIGAYTQLGWQWHWAGHELRDPDPNVDIAARISQLRWTLGLTVAL
jgi:hypothetical protein